ncbi:conserved hypothetical protein [Bradyrhizobium sp. ORS 278]|uniref:hypothetical protein n=1 Tax=Bradyrhizobium sp. (strain ORS 278) TaxID=114615 RepID=UPI0001508151|nr:hypothetical protein [Bradyrhizobium sp. ORS 278]CAL78119.1 conserved hypothetical protein [Bradyrhizobium sp. ORS 278]
MSFDAQTIYDLLPAIYRTRDAEQGGALRQLIGVIAEQVAVLEEDIEQLYDNQFIETCADWVVPYIGELIGYRQLYGSTPTVRSPRAEVADTIRLRRSKGTAAMLAQLARDVTGWDACTVEMFTRLATTQFLNHPRLDNIATTSVRGPLQLERIDGPFDATPRTVDVRRIASDRGRVNIGNVGIFLWRLRSYPLTDTPAFKLDDRRYLFNPLGAPVRLFQAPMTDDFAQATPSAVNAQMPLTRLQVDADRLARNARPPFAQFYGNNASFVISGVAADAISICNLSDKSDGSWAHMPAAGKVSIDPVLGRIAFGTAPAAPPNVSFHYGFSDDLGGGEYDRSATIDPALRPLVAAPAQAAGLQSALDGVSNGGAVEIGGSGRYAATPRITVTAANKRVELRAANKARPLLALGGEMVITGQDGSEVTLNGLVISGAALRVKATNDGRKLKLLRLRHCTLVPGNDVLPSGAPRLPDGVSLVVETADTRIEIERCIVGGLRVAAGAQLVITHSIVDATRDSGVAIAAPDNVSGGAALQISSSTVIGKVHTAELTLASNTIFQASLAQGDVWRAPIWADRRQQGCVRFCWLPLAARVPRRHRCLPTADADPRPAFTSSRYGDPGYCQLSRRTPSGIRQGADDGSEMGVFHDLFQSQRETNLRLRLSEYARFDQEVGFIFVT